MCGIVGCICRGAARRTVMGLKELEYRGYDSWGIAANGKEGITVIKKAGKICEFSDIGLLPEADVAIGHTRWATHGPVNETNAHPHVSCSSEIAVVHNGIIENYQELKRLLVSKGHVFISETDSEVIPHLIEEHCRKHSFEEACRKAILQLEGSYALLILSKGRLAAARKDSPLMICIGKDSICAASDAAAISGNAEKAVFLEEGELAFIGNGLRIISLANGNEINKPAVPLEKDRSAKGKGRFAHYMLKEISEQGETIKRAVVQEKGKLSLFADGVHNADEIYFIACGTAYHASLLGAYFLGKIAKKRVSAVLASEFGLCSGTMGRNALVIPVSQSGETADVLAAVKEARSGGAKIYSIINAPNSSLQRASDIFLLTNAGREIGVASTKAFTAQAALLALIAYACNGRAGEGKNLISETAEKIEGMLEKKADAMKQIEFLKGAASLFTIGRAENYPLALEAALKIKEISYIHAEGFAGGELKHGTLALIEKGTPCIAFVSNNAEKENILSNAMEIKARGGIIIGISPEKSEAFDFHIGVPDLGILTPIAAAIPAQLLAYHLAVWNSRDPDKPRNLAKSVTVK